MSVNGITSDSEAYSAYTAASAKSATATTTDMEKKTNTTTEAGAVYEPSKETATALTGGDPSKIEEMRNAFKKAYEQAEKTWGGKLPEISQKTYDAVMEGFDKLAKEAGLDTSN